MLVKPLPPPLPGAVLEPRSAPRVRPFSAPRPRGEIWPPTGLNAQSALGKFNDPNRHPIEKPPGGLRDAPGRPGTAPGHSGDGREKNRDASNSRCAGLEDSNKKHRSASASNIGDLQKPKATTEVKKERSKKRPQTAPSQRPRQLETSRFGFSPKDAWEMEVAGLNSLKLAHKHPQVLSDETGVKRMPQTGVTSYPLGHPSRMKMIQEQEMRNLFFTTTSKDPEFWTSKIKAPPPFSFKDIHIPTAEAMRQLQKPVQSALFGSRNTKAKSDVQSAVAKSDVQSAVAKSDVQSDLSITTSVPPDAASRKSNK